MFLRSKESNLSFECNMCQHYSSLFSLLEKIPKGDNYLKEMGKERRKIRGTLGLSQIAEAQPC